MENKPKNPKKKGKDPYNNGSGVDDKIKKGKWTDEENEILISEYNNQKYLSRKLEYDGSSRGKINWIEIQKKIQTRELLQARSHYNALVAADMVSVIERRILAKCVLSERYIEFVKQIDEIFQNLK